MLDQGTQYDLAQYRLEQAAQCLKAAKLLLDAGDNKSAANRSYYCIFHCMRAVLATINFDSKKHSGIISAFRREFIKTGILDVKYSAVIGNAFDLRGSSDYDDFYVVAKEAVLEQINNAAELLEDATKYLERVSC